MIDHYGFLTEDMVLEIKSHIQGKEVWDIMAGSLFYSKELLGWGASRIIAIDKAPMPDAPQGVQCIQDYVVNIRPTNIEVAFLSWPINHYVPGLCDLLSSAKVVIYLGTNIGMSACGDVDLFYYLWTRSILSHIPHERNSLIIYGNPTSAGRKYLPEEFAALHSYRMWSLEEATNCV